MTTLDLPEHILAVGRQALDLMHRHGALPSPENYELWFAYAGQRNQVLVEALDRAVKEGKASDLVHSRSLHAKFFALGTAELHEDVGNQLGAEIGKLAEALERAGADTTAFGKTLKATGDELEGGSADIQTTLQRLTAATRAIKIPQQGTENAGPVITKEIDGMRARMETIRKESLSDALTGLANRRCFDDRMHEAVREARADRQPLSVVIGDIDHFKRFNDTYGHAVGDQVLRLVGQCFKSNVKGRDTAARFGGEEFAVILPNTALANAAIVADDIRRSVESKKIVKRASGETLGSITLSLGVAEFVRDDDIADLINRADACLYAAKRAGRNRVLTERDLAGAEQAAVSTKETTQAAHNTRSTASLSFEYAVRALCRRGEIPLRSEIDLRHFHRFARWMVIAEPQLDQRKIPMRLVGSGFYELFKRDLTDTDYLDLVDPAIRDDAYNSAIDMIRQPCGLWQETPAAIAGTTSAKSAVFEYTAFPIFDESRNKRQVLVFVDHKFTEVTGFPDTGPVRRSQTWTWIDLGQGAPAIPRQSAAA